MKETRYITIRIDMNLKGENEDRVLYRFKMAVKMLMDKIQRGERGDKYPKSLRRYRFKLNESKPMTYEKVMSL